MTITEQRRSLSARLMRELVRLFLGLDSWRDRDVGRFTRQAVPMVRGAQLTMADLVARSINRQATMALGTDAPPIPIPPGAVTGLRGVDPAEVYARPFVELRTALSDGKSLTESVKLGANRTAQIAEADMQQTYAHANREAMQRMPTRRKPRYWRRTLQGEENCALCLIASTNRYSIDTLNPIHPGCDCDVQGVWRSDTTRAEEQAQLEQVHAAVKDAVGISDYGGRTVDYRKLIVTHGELGTMLAYPRHDFTGPAEVPDT